MSAPCGLGAEVVLVGAGPGDPGLLTIAGAAALARADVVVYDYLANPALLAHVREDAERIYVGKKGFSAHVGQDQINELLLSKARQLEARGGGVLVRLKGGDPFVFGRGGEEALALREGGFTCSVVSGVTSGVAAPACAGVPLTHRKLSSSVAFVTGNEDPTKDESALDWEGIAHGADTLCFYMGMCNLPLIARRLREAGRAADTPVILVRWGGMPEQEELRGTLATIAERAAAVDFQAPAIIVVGAVAGLSERLAWRACGPLAGMSVVVTRTRAQASVLSSRLGALGASVLELACIFLAPPSSYEALDACIAQLGVYGWVVFTSGNGVEAFFRRLERAGLDARALSAARVAAIGPATAAALARRGIVADLVPGEYVAEAAASAIIEAGLSSGERVLLPRAQEAREVLPRMLRARGALVDVAPAYRTLPPESEEAQPGLRRLAAGKADAVTFTSSSTVRNFMGLVRTLGPEAEARIKALDFYSIGPVTSATAREEGLAVAAEAEEHTIAGLVWAIVEHRAARATGK